MAKGDRRNLGPCPQCCGGECPECYEGLSDTYVLKAGLTSMGALYEGDSTDISDLYWYGEMELLEDITLTRIGETCQWGYENSDPESEPNDVQTRDDPAFDFEVGKVVSASLRLIGCEWEIYIIDSLVEETDQLTMPLLRTGTEDPSGSWQESTNNYDPMFDETLVRSYSGTVEDGGGP